MLEKLVHDWLWSIVYDGLWRRWAVNPMHCVGRWVLVMVPHLFNDDLGFTRERRFRPFRILPFAPVEAFAVPVLPG